MWHQPGAKPLSEAMMVVTHSQWVMCSIVVCIITLSTFSKRLKISTTNLAYEDKIWGVFHKFKVSSILHHCYWVIMLNWIVLYWNFVVCWYSKLTKILWQVFPLKDSIKMPHDLPLQWFIWHVALIKQILSLQISKFLKCSLFYIYAFTHLRSSLWMPFGSTFNFNSIRNYF